MSKYTKDRDGMWKAIRELRSFTRSQIAKKTGHHKATVSTYVNLLLTAGYLTVTEREVEGFYNERVYTLVKDSGLRRPRLDDAGNKCAPSGRQKMWTALKVMGRSPFDYRDISLVAGVEHSVAKEYCTALHRAAYLRIVRKSVPGTAAKYVFMVSADSGPLAPELRNKKREVFDPNLGKVKWRKEASDVQS